MVEAIECTYRQHAACNFTLIRAEWLTSKKSDHPILAHPTHESYKAVNPIDATEYATTQTAQPSLA